MSLKSIAICIVLLTSVSQNTIAQKTVNPEITYGSSTDANLPLWVKEMYKPIPDIKLVKSLYESYYKQNTFIKNEHTQYYKRWVHTIQNMADNDGKIKYPTRAQTDAENENYLQQIASRQASFGPGSTWNCIGPFDFDKDASGRSHAPGSAHVYTVKQSPSNANHLLAGTANAGVYKSTDKGQNWQALTNSLLIGECRAVEYQFDDSNVMYFGGNGSIYKSIDGGLNWQITGQASFNNVSHQVYAIVMFPNNNQKLLASTNYGLYLTTDGGSNWNQIINCPGSGEYMGDIEIHPTNPLIVYAIYNSKLVGSTNKITQFFKSTDGGLTFASQNSWPSNATTITGADHQRRAELAVTPANPDRIYAILTGSANGGAGLYGVYRSDDAGVTWTHYCCGTGPGGLASTSNVNVMGYDTDGSDNGGQYYYDLAIAADPINADKVHVAGIMQWISTDAGASFTCVNSWSNPGSNKYVHADIHDIRIYGNDVWVACDGGIFLSQNSGLTSFNRRQFGIAGTDFWGFGAGFKDGNIMLGGIYHNSHLLKNNNVYNNGWISYTGSADGYRGFVNPGYNKWVYNDSRKDKLPNTRTESFINFPFEKVPNASYYLGFSCPLIWHPNCFSTVYSGVDGILWRSDDDGISWTSVKSFGNGDVTDIEIGFDNPNVLYVVFSPATSSAARSIQKSTDAGLTWTVINIPTSVMGSNATSQLDITIDVNHSNTIWAAILSGSANSNNNKVFKSSDGGANWFNYTSTNLNGQVPQSIAFQRGTDGGVYLGTNKTVYYRNNSMADWELYNNELPALTSSMKMVPWYKGGKIRNASNRSVWEAPLYELSSPLAQITVDKMSSGCSRDTFLLSDYSVQYGTNATWQWVISPAPAYSTPLNQEQVQVVFGAAGSYSVSLSISDSLGIDSTSIANYISVSDLCDTDTIPGNAMELTADGQYGSSASPLLLNSNTVTMSAWIKSSGLQADYAGVLFFRGGSTTCGLNFKDTPGKIGYHWAGGNYGWNGGPIVPDNEWTHLALVVTPNSATIYMNGIAYTNNTSHAAEAFDTGLIIGNDPNSSARTFKGLFDKVCVYNRALSQNEIRELMHLTRKPNTDSTLVTYIQFNEMNGTAYDKSGVNHIVLAGGASRTTSTAPIGGGNSMRLNVTSAGTYNFGNTGLTINTTGSVFPDGEVCVTRINLQPDVTPSSTDSSSTCYWVLENYGSNAAFDTLQSIQLARTGVSFNACNLNNLYTRGANADGNVWGSAIDNADGCNGSLPNNEIQFTTGNSVYQSGQYAVGAHPNLLTAANWFLFSAQPELNGTVRLNWTNGREINTAHYEIERKSNGQGFEQIGKVGATGNSGMALNYEFIDTKPQRGLNEYRIKTINQNGLFTYSDSKKVLFRALAEKISVGPNPQKSGDNVYVYTAFQNLKYSVYDSFAKLYSQGTITNNVGIINTFGMKPGVYQMLFQYEAEQYLFKLVLQ